MSALLSDELIYEPDFFSGDIENASVDQLLDMRETDHLENNVGYESWQDVRRLTTVALAKLKAYAPPGAAGAHIGEMFALRGFAEIHLAEQFCPGLPLHDLDGLKIVIGGPLTTDSIFQRALADFDSAAVYAADSARVLSLARIGQARALIGLGRFQEAGDSAAAIPSDYTYVVEYQQFVVDNVWQGNIAFTSAVADSEGQIGLDFITAHDPRLETDSIRVAYDTVTVVYQARKYEDPNAPIVLASGIEAQLIRAEAALRTNSPTTWLALLNDLRRTHVSPAMADLDDPGTLERRIDLMFRERAFWLYGTGHRLGDLRRLTRWYDRSAASVFPTGTYHLGRPYGTATSIPFSGSYEGRFNPAITGCTSQ
jgi:hypothetical protein